MRLCYTLFYLNLKVIFMGKPKHVLDNELKIKADIALKNRLFVSGFDLSYLLQNIRSGQVGYNKANIVLEYVEGKPVGIAVHVFDKDFEEESNVHVFVKKAFRRKGIGKKLIKSLNLPKEKKKLSVALGSNASGDFWQKMGLIDFLYNDNLEL